MIKFKRNGSCDQNVKGNQLRSPSHAKIRCFDLEGLRDIEPKNILSKS